MELYKRADQLEPINATMYFQLSTLYQQIGRTEDAKWEMDEYKNYKEMTERLRERYRDMRQEPQE